MQKLRVGIIGAGRIGQVHAKSITYHIPQAEIVAISDLFPENAQKVADDLGIPKAVQDYHEILNDPTVDAVLICSSTDTHADIAVDCFQNTAHTNSRVCISSQKNMRQHRGCCCLAVGTGNCDRYIIVGH